MESGIYQQNCCCQFRKQRPGHWLACAENELLLVEMFQQLPSLL